MCKTNNLKDFKKNDFAIAEEFTSIPSLSIIIIGFTIFILLVANVYSSYETKIVSIDKYQIADYLISKLINPESFFIKTGLIIDYPILNSHQGKNEFKLIQEEFYRLNVNFILRLNWYEECYNFPNDLTNNFQNQIAISRPINIYLNEVETVPGKLTLIMWNLN